MDDVFKLITYIVWGILAFIGVMLLGDYLGYKVGRKPLARVSALIALGVVVALAIVAAIIFIPR